MALAYQYRGDPILNLNKEMTRVKEVGNLENQIRVPVMKDKTYEQASYRTACMMGAEHPLELEYHDYMLHVVRVQDIDDTVHIDQVRGPNYFNEMETEFIKSVTRAPEVEWAIDNSFDGLYIIRTRDHANFRVVYKFAVYLKKEQVTFWKLKYS